MKADC